MKKNKKLAKTALGGLLAVAVAGATFAWFTDSFKFENVFETGKYSDEFVETFTPPTDWTPGVTTPKSVEVTNTGDVDMVVRVKFSETWSKDTNKNETIDESEVNNLSYKFNLGSESEPIIHLAALKNLSSGFKTELIENETGYWYVIYDDIEYLVADEKQPVEAYYIAKLKGGATSSGILDSVTMNELIPANATSKEYYSVDGGTNWIEVPNTGIPSEEVVTNTKYVTTTDSGYSDAVYQLNITVETIQADRNAVSETWGTDNRLGSDFQTYLDLIFREE